MPGHISIRESIAWPPEPAAETTSTLVLTSDHGYFVDIRLQASFVYDPLRQSTLPILPPDALEWGFAGTSRSRKDDQGRTHARWHHFVDSSVPLDSPPASDKGIMTSNHLGEPGLTLEKGEMVNPKTEKVQPYEEVWRDVPIEHDHLASTCVVLKADQPDARGMIMRLGQYVQGILKIDDDVLVERWEAPVGGIFECTARIASGLFCGETLNKAVLVAVDVLDPKKELGEGEIHCAGVKWLVVEKKKRHAAVDEVQ